MIVRGRTPSGLASLALVAWAAAVPAQTPPPLRPTGAEAVAPGEPMAPQLAAASAGDAEAILERARRADRGIDGPPDPQTARALYREAGEAGSAEAQFNLAVMLDAGIGGARDARAALVWYARAALRGHDRARLNLGLVHNDPDGPAPNGAQARHWFALAGTTLPAARDRAVRVPEGAAPTRPAVAYLARRDDRVEVVWTAPPGPADATYLVEARAAAPSDAAPLARVATGGSAAFLDLPPEAPVAALRVVQLDPAGELYAASAWIVPGGPAPEGVVRFELAQGEGAEGLARLLAGDLAAAAVWSHVSAAEADASAVAYRYAQDAGLARRVAAAMPVLSPDDVRRDPGLDVAPGEVVARIGGAPGG